MSKLALCLWFDNQAEAAANFYVDAFRSCGQPASLGSVLYYGENAPQPKGSVLTITCILAGQEIICLNGGPHYQLSPAMSLFVKCADQPEVDRFWETLLEDGGKPVQCGWLTDRFGVSWQIVPTVLLDMLHDLNDARAQRAMQAMMQMVKLDVAALQRAYDGG
ncbi:MAG TPA: VOC family protein [Dongiaceae bacterium]